MIDVEDIDNGVKKYQFQCGKYKFSMTLLKIISILIILVFLIIISFSLVRIIRNLKYGKSITYELIILVIAIIFLIFYFKA